MAPEVLRKEGLDFASDIWSLGCTVIEMATGRPPWGYKASDPMAVVLKIAFSSERPKFPAHLSEEGMDFLAKCLERDPESRWTAEELLDHPFYYRETRRRNAHAHLQVFWTVLELTRRRRIQMNQGILMNTCVGIPFR
ncbi:hypothetical protein OIU78_013756 [Salix suchowensis]|nr:hypothetical protein OIU78_013756 [Salix suchowensis]